MNSGFSGTLQFFLTYMSIFLSVQIGLAQSYSISGKIKDFDNSNVVGASVYVNELDLGTITDKDGVFVFNQIPLGQYTLNVSYLGYESKTLEVRLDKNVEIELTLQVESRNLNEVVVFAEEGDIKMDLEDPQMGITKLSANSIEKLPAVGGEVDLIKALQFLPGITNGGEGSSGLNVRGGASDQNLVLLDNAIIYNTSHLYGFLSVFNNDAISSVNLYKGGMPAKYGGRVSSVLDVKQQKGYDSPFTVKGGLGALSSRLTVRGRTLNDKASYMIGGRASFAHLFMPYIEAISGNDMNFYDLNLRLDYSLDEKNELYLSSYFGRDALSLEELDYKNNYRNLGTSMGWNHQFNNKLYSNLILSSSRYRFDFVYDREEYEWYSEIENYQATYNFDYYIGPGTDLNFGVNAILDRLTPGTTSPTTPNSPVNPIELDEKRAFEGAAYVSVKKKLSDRLSVVCGLRYSYFQELSSGNTTFYVSDQPVVFNHGLHLYQAGEERNDDFSDWLSPSYFQTYATAEPRASFSYLLSRFSSLKAGYSRSAQYLHIVSNATGVTNADLWTTSNRYIKPQVSDQYSLGYYHRLGSSYNLSVEGYFKNVDNRIDYIPGAKLIRNNNIETEILAGESRAFGLEFMLTKKLGRLTGWLAYTLSRAEQRTPGGVAGGPGINNGQWYKANYDRTHDLSITSAYNLNEKWQLNLSFVYQTGRPTTYPEGQFSYNGTNYILFADRNSFNLPDYHHLDVFAVYKPSKNQEKRWQGEWMFGVYNVYARRNTASIIFDSVSFFTGFREPRQLSFFGTIIPSITYNFKFS